MPNYHRANSSSSASKYFQPMWYPPGLTCTQKKKLQRLRFQEKREQEIKKLRDKQFKQRGPMVSQGKVRRVKAADQPARPVKLPQLTNPTGTTDRSDRPDQLVGPVEVVVVTPQVSRNPEMLHSNYQMLKIEISATKTYIQARCGSNKR